MPRYLAAQNPDGIYVMRIVRVLDMSLFELISRVEELESLDGLDISHPSLERVQHDHEGLYPSHIHGIVKTIKTNYFPNLNFLVNCF
jgi:hypothetical protein